VYACVYVWVLYVCMCARVHVWFCMCMRVSVCVWAFVRVYACGLISPHSPCLRRLVCHCCMCYRLLPPTPPQVGSGQYGQVFEAYLQGASAKGVGAGRIVAVKTCKEGNPEQIKVGG